MIARAYGVWVFAGTGHLKNALLPRLLRTPVQVLIGLLNTGKYYTFGLRAT